MRTPILLFAIFSLVLLRANAANCTVGSFSSNSLCVACPSGNYCPGNDLKFPCNPGTYQPNNGSSSCLPTQPGTYAGAFGSSQYMLCPLGMFAASYNSTECSSCPIGSTSQQLGSTICLSTLSCTAGTHVLSGGTGCMPCPAGQFSITANALQCTLCPLGTFNAKTGANSSDACVRCPTGTYGEGEGATSAAVCTACPAGTFNPSSGSTTSAACRQCLPGTFSATVGASSPSQCVECAAGSFTAYPGASACDVCRVGTYSAVVGARSSLVCLACPAGTWSNVTGAGSAGACTACLPGTFGAAPGLASCLVCDQGHFSESAGATTCQPCPFGTYNPNKSANSSLWCTSCPAGTYGSSAAAKTITDCIPCAPGEFSSTPGASVVTACRFCPMGSYAAGSGSAACSACPAGTANSNVGSKSESDCVPCTAGSFANASGLPTCLPCEPGSFQNASGQPNCLACAPGSSAPLAGSTGCTLCAASYYAPTAGLAQCLACGWGTFQQEVGGTSCASCPSGFEGMPGALVAALDVNVCGGLSRSIVLNWGPVANPVLLGANVSIVEELPPWLTVHISGATTVFFTSDFIPSSAALNRTLDLTVSVTHTCRAGPWLGSVSLRLLRADPALIRDSSVGESGVEACPGFSVEYSTLLGTCASQTAVVAMLANSSVLPAFVSFYYSNAAVVIAGTVPAGTAPFEVMVVAQLGTELFRSVSTTIALSAEEKLTVLGPTTVIRACPYVQIVFSVVRSGRCGKIMFAATFVNGSELPPFLTSSTGTAGTGEATMTVFGTVPEGYADFTIVALASTGGKNYSSDPVAVTRPLLTVSANVSIVTSGGGGDSGSNSKESSSRALHPLVIGVRYGAATQVIAAVETGAVAVADFCSSLSLALSNSAHPPGAGDGEHPRDSSMTLPPWISVTLSSTTSAVISISPTSDVPLGTSFVLYAWATDGLVYPGFNLTIVTMTSLRVNATTLSGELPVVSTPASLLQLQISVLGATAASPVLLCPAVLAAAFCSFSPATLSLGAFGTPDGVNAVLGGLSVSMPQGQSRANITLQLEYKDSVNPNPLTVEVPLAAIRGYAGVTQTKALALSGKVGKPLAVPIADYFHSDNGPASVTYALVGGEAWLAVQSGFIAGTPPQPTLMSFVVDASDKFTRVLCNGTVNVTWPLSPTATVPVVSRWRIPSSTQLDVQLPRGLIVDPENGTISFTLQQFTGSSTLQPLPQFLSFDASNLHIGGTPQSSDVGMYALVLIGTSQWGPWSGNATVLLTIVVDQSWSDFLAWVYSIAGYCASGFAVVTWALVYRAFLMNMYLFRKRLRPAPPDTLCVTGCYTLQHVAPSPARGAKTIRDMDDGDSCNSNPILAEDVKAVKVTWVEKPGSSPGASSTFLPRSAYLAMHQRLSHVKVKTDALVGVPWMRITPARDKTVELVLDIPALQQLVEAGKVLTEDEYYVEVLSTGRWYSGTILEAFTFRVSDLFYYSAVLVPEQVDAPPSVRDVSCEVTTMKCRLEESESMSKALTAQIERQRRLMDQLNEKMDKALPAAGHNPKSKQQERSEKDSDCTNQADPTALYKADPTAGSSSTAQPHVPAAPTGTGASIELDELIASLEAGVPPVPQVEL